MKRKQKEVNFNLKIDDVMVSLICNYHNIHHAEVLSFFGNLVETCLKDIKPNISNNEVALSISFNRRSKKMQYRKTKIDLSKLIEYTNIWVVRGFYPNTKVPFKLSLTQRVGVTFDSEGDMSFAKVTLGKPSLSNVSSDAIHRTNELLAESELLDIPIDDEKIEYKVKSFRTMTPKGLKKFKKKA